MKVADDYAACAMFCPQDAWFVPYRFVKGFETYFETDFATNGELSFGDHSEIAR